MLQTQPAMPSNTAETHITRIPYARLPFASSALFIDYCSRYEQVASYYSGDYRSMDERIEAVRRARSHPRNEVADTLLDQNARWGLDESTRANIERLRHTDTAAVVTGQQVTLFTGPLYTVYKIITTLQLARQLSAEAGAPVVPVFWLQGEDHDFEEMASVSLLQDQETVTLRYPEETGAGVSPVGRMRFSSAIEGLIAQLDEWLPATDYKAALLERVAEAYHPGATFLDAFVRLIKVFFPDSGLIFLDPSDVRLKQLSVPLFRKAVLERDSLYERLEAVSRRLETSYHAQVHVRPLNLFLFEGGGRYALIDEPNGPAAPGAGLQFSEADLLERIESRPETFSPNVLLRPLMQDSLLPTAAYVGGPGEIAYFAQLGAAYEWADLRMPLLYPRAGVTLVESRIRSLMERYHLGFDRLDRDPERHFRRLVLSQMAVDIEAEFESAAGNLEGVLSGLQSVIEKIDPTLVRSAESTRAALEKELFRLRDRVVKAEKRRHEEIRGQIDRIHAHLLPQGIPQERLISPLYYLNKYGPGLIAALERTLSTATTEHQMVAL